jgi:hypothetical protein
MVDPEAFQQQLETLFEVHDGPVPIQLRLVEVTDEGIARGVRQFSLFFRGPAERALPQGTYSLQHEALGSLGIFLVPILGSTRDSILYQACFSVSAPGA